MPRWSRFSTLISELMITSMLSASIVALLF
jgi:hypothetical protein